MNVLLSLILIAQVLSAIGVIVLVLLQHGKGADMGAAFGSGASGSLFGATGSANFLSRTTAAFATVFFVSTLGLAFMQKKSPVASGSVMEQPASSIPGAPSAPAAPLAPANGAPAAPQGGEAAPGSGATQKNGPASQIPK